MVLKLRQAGTGWAQQELSLDGPPLQSLSVDRGRAGAIVVIIWFDDGHDDDNDDDDDDNGFIWNLLECPGAQMLCFTMNSQLAFKTIEKRFVLKIRQGAPSRN